PPAAFHVARHCCNMYNPLIFFSNRVVPFTPCSLVNPNSRQRSVTIGAFNSTPARLHVPLEIYAQPGCASADTAATAHPVSWLHVAIACIDGENRDGPSFVPLSTIGVQIFRGNPARAISGSAHPRVFQFSNCVVLASDIS